MSEMRQCNADPHREIWGESGAAILGVLGVSEVSDDAEPMRCVAMVNYDACAVTINLSTFS